MAIIPLQQVTKNYRIKLNFSIKNISVLLLLNFVYRETNYAQER